MLDRIKKIKIKKADGTVTDYIPIGADAENIDTTDGESVQLKLNKQPYYYNNVATMKTDSKLKAGDMAITLGYYEPGDGGGAKYEIKNTTSKHYEQLNNGLVAECIFENGYNIKQYGAKGDGVTNDTAAIKQVIIDADGDPIYFPSGTYLLFEQLSQYQDFNFVGDGETSIIKLMPADQTRPETYDGRIVYNCYMIAQEKNINTGYNLFLKDIVLDASKEDYKADIFNNGSSKYDHITCIDLYQPARVILDNVIIRNALIEGCYIYSPSDYVTISNSKFINNGFYQEDASGCHLEGLHNNTNVSNCIFNNNGFHGLLIAGNRMVINNIHCENNGYTGLMLWGGASFNNISNIYISNNNCGVQLKAGYNPTQRESPWEDWMALAEGNNISNLTTVNNDIGIVFGNSIYTKIMNWDAYENNISYGFYYNVNRIINGNVINYRSTPRETEYVYGSDSDPSHNKIIFAYSCIENENSN